MARLGRYFGKASERHYSCNAKSAGE